MIKLTFSKAYEVVKEMVLQNIPVVLYGEPGIGKSSLVKKVGKDLNMEVYTFNVNYLTRNDLVIMTLTADKDSVDYKIPKYLIDIIQKEDNILFLDEFNMNLEMQSIFLELILEKRLFNVPVKSKIILAGNDTHNQLVVETIHPLNSRIFKIKLIASYEDFVNFIYEKYKLNENILIYLSFIGSQQENFINNEENINPRIHEFIIRSLATMNMDEYTIISGWANEVYSNKFINFKKEIYPLMNKSVEELVKNFSELKISQKLYTVNKTLNEIKNIEKITSIIKTLHKTDSEFAILLFRKYLRLTETDASKRALLCSQMLKKLPEIAKEIKEIIE